MVRDESWASLPGVDRAKPFSWGHARSFLVYCVDGTHFPLNLVMLYRRNRGLFPVEVLGHIPHRAALYFNWLGDLNLLSLLRLNNQLFNLAS